MARIGAFKSLCLDAALAVAGGRPGYGILCDARLGRDALWRAAGTGLWIGRPVEWPGSRPLMLEPELGPDLGGLQEWPLEHVVAQEETVLRLFHAARRNRLEFLLEVIPSKAGPVDDETTAKVIQRFYDIGVCPDWWKLEPMQTDAAWAAACAAIARNDRHTRGIVVLGLGSDEATLKASFEAAARHPLVKGFAVGRTIFAKAAEGFMSGTMSEADAVAAMKDSYARVAALWDAARATARRDAA